MKRIIPCLDVKDGRVVKGVKFEGLSDVSSPVELAKAYNISGADELVFYDITASNEGRKAFSDVLTEVSKCVSIPLIIGGGISTIEDFDKSFELGASKVSINSGALKNPQIIGDAARKFGSERVILSIDAKKADGSYRVFTSGGMKDAGLELLQWVRQGVGLGAGELVLNSIDTDGVKGGFDIEMLEAVMNVTDVPIIASGGAGSIKDFVELFTKLPDISAGLAASVFHFGEVKIMELKKELQKHGIAVATFS